MVGGEGPQSTKDVAIHWFRQDLRLHDNTALYAALKDCDVCYPVFIFDGKTASTENVQFNRMRFLRESLEDLDHQLVDSGGRLHATQGGTTETLRRLFKRWSVTRLTYQMEPEAIWTERDRSVEQLCRDYGVTVISTLGHTLWDPYKVIEQNGGEAPLTYGLFNHIADTLGPPARPCDRPDFTFKLAVDDDYDAEFSIPSYEKLGFGASALESDTRINKWYGGETTGLLLLKTRICKEREAFSRGIILPNQYLPDLVGPYRTLSPYLKFGNISVRRVYWAIVDGYREVVGCGCKPSETGIVAQIIWREYFYMMSVRNENFGVVKDNPVCLPIPWYEDKELAYKVEMGQTGYPFVDAIMNQLRAEGWIHHVCRHMVSSYLTRGDLWLSWEYGVRIFEKYLLDYDWSICAGNWMWTSSSAFEKALDCPKCFDPVKYGQRMDPSGDYIRRYVPALRNMPLKYLFNPWLAPQMVQEDAGCVVGRDYPLRMNNHLKCSRENSKKMERMRSNMADLVLKIVPPTSKDELWLPDSTQPYINGGGDSLKNSLSHLCKD